MRTEEGKMAETEGAVRQWGLLKTPHDGRTWSVEIHPNGMVKVTDIYSPTGYSEWMSVAVFNGQSERPNLYEGVAGLFTSESPPPG